MEPDPFPWVLVGPALGVATSALAMGCEQVPRTSALAGEATERTSQALAPDPWADIRAYGAVTSTSCTSTSSQATTNNRAIASALRALTSSGGGTLFVPAGRFCVSTSIVLGNGLLGAPITVAGAGSASVLLGPSDANIGYMIQIGGSYNTVRDLYIDCNSANTSGIGLVPVGSATGTAAQIQGNSLARLLIGACTMNAAGGTASDAVALSATATGAGTTENSIEDIFITNTGRNAGGNALHFFHASPGYATDNHVARVTVENTLGTTGVNLEAGASGNLFEGLVLASGGGAGLVNLSVAAGANYNTFSGVSFDNDGVGAVDIVNASPYTQFIGTDANTVQDITGALMLGPGTSRFGGYSYSGGLAVLNASGGVEFSADAAFDTDKTLSVLGPSGVGSPAGLSVGARVSASAVGLSSVATFSAPNVAGVLPATFVTDSAGSGPLVITQNYDVAAHTGSELVTSVTSTGATILSLTNGNASYSQLTIGAAPLYLNSGGGLVLKGTDRKCVLLTASGGALVATNDYRPCP
jgi:hypothetical protein